MSIPTLPPWVPLASRALTFAARQDYTAAADVLQSLADKFGPDVIPAVCLAWIDTVLSHVDDNPWAGDKPVGIAWMAVEDGAVTDADQTPPPVRWAGRAFAARAAFDQTQFTALVESVESDEEWAENVGALLNVCATQLAQWGWGGHTGTASPEAQP